MSGYVLNLSEGERQALLLALGHLAVERPGWDDMLARIAVRIDNHTEAGRPDLYDKFRELHARMLAASERPKGGE
jgi:hypothetical protein